MHMGKRNQESSYEMQGKAGLLKVSEEERDLGGLLVHKKPKEH